ncbi:mechanosensitive ion channel family protein [Desulfuromonas thiophila]|uniref:Small-conductance mechanosensitive channel n=1 Tax=Desulfuromonas thiophila TaxID=57664 RepID=A0A1G6WU48_9BACT|nr:mechanosensitive ion channel domain-containing protein [Desulfuromonas thiophila]SDD69309.1 Small-conductance mechanosensitive channel [Desulfuromonas thiophila]
MEQQSLQHLLSHFSFTRLLLALLFLLATWGFTQLLRLALQRLADRFSRHRLLISSSYPLLRLLLWLAAILFVVVVIFQPPTGTLLTLGASVGLALGLGAQDIIRNIIAGVVILLDRPFRVGDMVAVGDHYGEVTHIGLRSIHLHSFGDSTINLPNALVLGQAVANANSGALDELVEIPFSLPAASDTALLRTLAEEAAFCSPYVYLKKPVVVLVEDAFDRQFLTRIRVKAYVFDVRYERLFASDVCLRFKLALRQRGLTPPLPAGAPDSA